MSQLLLINIDDKKYTLTRESVNKFPDSRFCKIISKTIKDPNVVFINDMIYINRDPYAFAYIVDIIRGYNRNLSMVTDTNLKHKIQVDLDYFGLNIKPNLFDIEINEFVDLPELVDINTNSLDTSVLKSNDENKINKFMESLNDFLSTDPISAINIMSSDENLKEYMADQNKQFIDSDTDSLDFVD